MYVYVEYILIENIVINYILLYVTKMLTKSKTRKTKLFISSLIGSLYILVVFFPSFQFMGKFIIKFFVSVLMVIIAFNPQRLNVFIKQISAFYLASFVFAGTVTGIYYILNNNFTFSNIYFRDSKELIRFLVIGISIAIILINYIFRYHRAKIKKEGYLTNITITLNNKTANLQALIDTGNSLKEPISKKPVIIVEYVAIREILPEKLKELYKKGDKLDLNVMAKIMEEIGDETKLMIIPFKSLGNENGILIGFKPDSVSIYSDDKTKKIKDDIIVAIYNNKLADDEEYNGLLHPEILG